MTREREKVREARGHYFASFSRVQKVLISRWSAPPEGKEQNDEGGGEGGGESKK